MRTRGENERIVVQPNYADFSGTVQQALSVTMLIADTDERALSLAGIVSILSDVQPPSYVQFYLNDIMGMMSYLRDDAMKSMILATLGESAAKYGDTARAQSYIDQAYNVAQFIREDGDRSWAMKHVAKSGIFVAEGSPEALQQTIQKAVNIANFITIDYYRASVMGVISESLAKMGRVDYANTLIKDSLKIARQSDGERFRGRGLGHSTLISEERMLNRTMEAQRFRDSAIREVAVSIAKVSVHSSSTDGINEALEIAAEIRDPSVRISTLCEVASAIGEMGDGQKAGALMSEAMQDVGVVIDPFYRSMVLCNIAAAYADNGDFRPVDGLMNQAIQLAYTIVDEFHNSWAIRKIVETLLKLAQITTDPKYLVQSCETAFWVSNDKDFYHCARSIAEMLVKIIAEPFLLAKTVEKTATEIESARNDGLEALDSLDEKLTQVRSNLQNKNFTATKTLLYQIKLSLNAERSHFQSKRQAEQEVASIEGLLKSLEGLDMKSAREIFATLKEAVAKGEYDKAMTYARECHDSISAAKILGSTSVKITPMLPGKFPVGVWSIADVLVKNSGLSDIKNIEVRFSPPIQMLGTSSHPLLKQGDEKKFSISIKSMDMGKFPIKLFVHCTDHHDAKKTFENEGEIWIEVAKS